MQSNTVIWFTGQPHSGKTTLALKLVDYYTKINKTVSHIDGDFLRKMTNNNDYSIDGRRQNVTTAQVLAKIASLTRDYTIVSLVSPFRDLRESFKADSEYNVREIYLHSKRIREGRMVDYYEIPLDNFLSIDTDITTIDESTHKIIDYVG